MKATVDPDRCQGHARCWELAPEVFGLDEEGHGMALVAEVAGASEDAARKAARNCPERAIILD